MRPRDIALITYVVVCALFLIWPGYAWVGNRVEPWILGLPFALFWNVAWAMVTFVVLLGYDRATAREEGS